MWASTIGNSSMVVRSGSKGSGAGASIRPLPVMASLSRIAKARQSLPDRVRQPASFSARAQKRRENSRDFTIIRDRLSETPTQPFDLPASRSVVAGPLDTPAPLRYPDLNDHASPPPRLRGEAAGGRCGAAAAGPRRFHRPGGRAQKPQGVHRIGARRAARRSTMCCSSARPASARRRWRRSWRASSASISARPRGR